MDEQIEKLIEARPELNNQEIAIYKAGIQKGINLMLQKSINIKHNIKEFNLKK